MTIPEVKVVERLFNKYGTLYMNFLDETITFRDESTKLYDNYGIKISMYTNNVTYNIHTMFYLTTRILNIH